MPDIELIKAKMYYDRFYSTDGVWSFVVAIGVVLLIGCILAWV